MSQDYNPSVATYDPKECGKPMNDAVEDLAAKTGQDPKDFVGRTLMEVANLADETYDELPEFWRVWKEWHMPQSPPEMGDL